MKVRAVTSNDRAEWTRMRTALWPESPEDHPIEIARFLAKPDPSVAVFVAEDRNGAICGLLEAGTRPYAEGCLSSPVGYIEGWWVDPPYRRKGFGAALVRAAEAWARARGLEEMASDADLENELSHSAHRSLGYTETQRIVCFRKSLPDAI